jgi:alpha 1,3-glucosidase
MPPLWAFGFHQSKWGYQNQTKVESIIHKFDQHNIPMDVMWLDLDHLKGKGPWEYNHDNYPDPKHMTDLLAEKHRHLVRSCDCHMPHWPDHIQYQEALKQRFFIRFQNGSDWYAWGWPGWSSWPDYWNERVMDWGSTLYYYNQGRDFTTPNTWFWNDMNEISAAYSLETTVPKQALLINGLEAREAHSLYGLSQTSATYFGLLKRDELVGLPRQRPWVLSRSWFAGSAKYTWVWTGDNWCIWDHLQVSIPEIMVAGLTGMPFIGADVGGFQQSVDGILMARWCQAGAWIYPFFRSHCYEGSAFREPWEFQGDNYTQIVNAIRDRYMLLAVWYTHSIYTLTHGRSPVVPLFYEWPEIEAFHDVEHEALLGDSFLVCPVLSEGVKKVTITKPPGIWYDFVTGLSIHDGYEKPVTMFDIPVFLRGGRIVPLYCTPGQSTNATIRTPLTLMIGGDEHGEAEGVIYLDDGLTFAYESGEFIHRRFTFKNGVLSSRKVSPQETKPPEFLRDSRVANVTVYLLKPDGTTDVTRISGLNLKLVEEWDFHVNRSVKGTES